MKTILLYLLILIIMSSMFFGCANKQKNDNNKETKEVELNKIDKLSDVSMPTKFLCDEIKDSEEIHGWEYDYLYLNGSVYEFLISFEKTFSNNQHCKKIEGISYDRYVEVSGSYGDIIVKDNRAYSVINGLIKPYQEKYVEIIALQEGVKSINYVNQNNQSMDYNNINFYVLKNDGNVYKYVVDYDYNRGTASILSSSEVIYSKEEFGEIKYFYYSNPSDNYPIDNLIILTNENMFNFSEIKTAECSKYADVKCEIEIKPNKNYEKYKAEIFYSNKDIILDKDNKYYLNIFFRN